MHVKVQVYVCPTEGCGDYYGASGENRLHNQIVGTTGPNFEAKPVEQHFTRAHCPSCRANGQKVVRVLVGVDIPLADVQSASPVAEAQHALAHVGE